MTQLDPITETVFPHLEKLINQALELDPHSLQQLQTLTGHIFLIEITDLNKRLGFEFDDSGLKLMPAHSETDSQVIIRGRSAALLGLLMNRNGEHSALLPDDLELRGNINIAQKLQQILQQMDLDWEELIARYTGDTMARKIHLTLATVGKHIRATGKSFAQNGSEYLRFETETLPDQLLVDEFTRDVDTLRNDVERLQQRVKRLERE